MKPLALDTPLHVEQRWIAGMRAKGALWRLQRLVSMTHFCWQAAYDALQRARPTWPTSGTGGQYSGWGHCCNGLWMRQGCRVCKFEVSHASG
jgi:hypothetical protein